MVRRSGVGFLFRRNCQAVFFYGHPHHLAAAEGDVVIALRGMEHHGGGLLALAFGNFQVKLATSFYNALFHFALPFVVLA